MSTSTEPAADACPSCGEPGMAAYCPRCGEKRQKREDWQLSRIFGEAFSEFTNLEHSKLWQTLRLLLFKPGQLTSHYWHGQRKRFVGPVKLYLVFFALSLLLYSIHQPTAVYDVSTLIAAGPDGRFAQLLDELASARSISRRQVADEVSARWQNYISLSQLVYPLFVALVLQLLFRRRPLYFAQHLIFSLHVLAFMFLSFSLLWPFYLVFGVEYSVEHFTSTYVLLTAGSLLWTAVYLLLGVRRAYGERWLPSVTKSVLVFLTYFLTSMSFLWGALFLAMALTRRAG